MYIVFLVAVAALIVFTIIGIEIFAAIVEKREKARWDKMPPDEQRKYQEEMFKRHQMG